MRAGGAGLGQAKVREGGAGWRVGGRCVRAGRGWGQAKVWVGGAGRDTGVGGRGPGLRIWMSSCALLTVITAFVVELSVGLD